MTRIESGILIPENLSKRITRADIIKRFGFDYVPVVVERLRYWGKLPEGHNLNFFSTAEAHKGSSGLYLLEEIVGDNWIFLQAMFEGGVSTKHKHGERVVELYDPLAGESLLSVDGKTKLLEAKKPLEVLPGQVHQLQTFNKVSLNLLIMKNSAHIPRSKLHIPVE